MSKSLSRVFSIALTLLVVVILGAACGGNANAPAPTSPPVQATQVPSQVTLPSGTAIAEIQIPQGNVLPWLSVYFTDPNPPDDRPRGLDVNVIIPLINQTRRTIDLAYFDFNMPSLVDALAAAQQRGVKIRMVLDTRNGSLDVKAARGRDAYDALAAIQRARLPFVDGGRSSGLMHEKLLILDGRVMFVGSMNGSWNDILRNNNNLLMITSQRLIENYQAVFNNMYEGKFFGSKRPEGARRQVLTIDGITVENYFAPPDEVMSRIISEVNKATQSIRFMSFTFTDKDLASAIMAKSRQRVTVEGVIENRGASQGTMPTFACNGLAVRVDGNSYTMHHKVFIIDEKVVITGSFNHTKAANTINDESILIIRNAAVAQLYMGEFQKVFSASQLPKELTCDGRDLAPIGAGVCPNIEATCDELTCEQALACLKDGNDRLDRNNDGVACDSKCK